ncbi:MAG: hypothetical protein IH831_01550 [Planctomycetes bacterium]|nr:hypothetical protein [Planctomycetota bacterium]
MERLLKRKGFREGLAKAQARLQVFAKEDMPKVVAAIEARQQEFQQSDVGVYTTDDWVENLLYVTDLVEIDPAGLSADEIKRKAAAWLKREEIRANLRSEPEGGKPQKPQKRGRPEDPQVAKRREHVKELRDEGKSPGDIAALLTIPVDIVNKDLTRLKS